MDEPGADLFVFISLITTIFISFFAIAKKLENKGFYDVTCRQKKRKMQTKITLDADKTEGKLWTKSPMKEKSGKAKVRDRIPLNKGQKYLYGGKNALPYKEKER
jgi:hypothetical protein